jgi:hypothetical protein
LGERFAWIALILPALAAISSGAASGLELKPFKDRLFSYPATLSEDLGGRYRIVDYRETRDIGQRDEVPERRVHGRYVSLKVRKVQSDVAAATTSGEKLRYFAVGDRQRPAIITVYLHGKGGSRRQGVDDFTFGGNFNRIKNLMADNGGLYLSPDFTDFAETGKAEVAAIIRHHHALSPGAAVIVACGSMGALICYRLAADEALAGIISGYVLLGAPPDDGIFASPAFRGRTPFFLGHGSADSVYPIAAVEAFMRRFEARSPGYPVRLVRFETGSHGTPIRMTDWRDTINWMLALR